VNFRNRMFSSHLSLVAFNSFGGCHCTYSAGKTRLLASVAERNIAAKSGD
jgi:hypothetical protein